MAFSVYLLHKEIFGIIGRATLSRRKAWFGSYITTILQRDVRDLANIERLTILPRVLSLIAARAASLLIFSELSRSIAIPQTTLKRYMSLLETTFLFQPLPAWSGNLGKRLVKAPKVMRALDAWRLEKYEIVELIYRNIGRGTCKAFQLALSLFFYIFLQRYAWTNSLIVSEVTASHLTTTFRLTESLVPSA